MKNNLLKEAKYADIIMTLINPPCNITSLFKLIFLTLIFSDKNIKEFKQSKYNIINNYIGNSIFLLIQKKDDIKIIYEILYRLESIQLISINQDIISINKKIETPDICNLKKLNNIISNFNNLDNETFYLELL
ncbi:MAG: hypothetical protein SPF17_07465 [Candidatus Mucispirillum faecigallinarum]|nr:hypothetical protein [Candidatus Mucispirillum faecigallinarum]